MNIKNTSNINLSAFTATNSASISPTIDWTAAKNAKQFVNNLKSLETLIKDNTRSIQYWDVYRFSDSVEDASDFATKWANLENNHSLVINADFDGYTVGDVVIKADDGNQITVKSRQNGIYQPKSYKDNVLTYGYISSVTDNDKEVSVSGFDVGTVTDKIYSAKLEPSNGECSFNAIEGIQPVIKLFLDGEEVYSSYQIVLDNNKYKISDLPPVPLIVVVK